MTTAPRSLAEARGRRPAGGRSESDRVRSFGSYRSAPNLAKRVGQRVAGQAGQLRVVGPLEAGPAVGPRRVADDLADRRAGVDPVRARRSRRPGCARGPSPSRSTIRPARHGPGGRDDRRVVGRPRRGRAPDDPPVAGRAGEDRERRRDRTQRDVDRRRAERPAARRSGRASAAPAAASRRQRAAARRRRRLDALVGQREEQADDERRWPAATSRRS